MTVEMILLICFIAVFLVGLFLGYPVALVLGGTAAIFVLVGEALNRMGFWIDVDIRYFGLTVNRLFAVMSNPSLVPIPLFVFMGLMLERSGIARDLLNAFSLLLERVPGGMALGVVLIGIILAASTGIVGASVIMLATMALPTMIVAGYDKALASGTVAAAGTLGILIPPSIMLLIMADQMLLPVPDLFAAALLPGLLLGAIYLVLIVLIAVFSPHRVPPTREKTVPRTSAEMIALAGTLLQALVAPLLLIGAVLGSIVAGIASPAEASGIGAAGAILLTLLRGRMSWHAFDDALQNTARTTAFILLLIFGASAFAIVMRGLGGDEIIHGAVLNISSDPNVVVLFVLALIFLLGFMLDWIEITLIIFPLVLPLLQSLGVDILWFTILAALCLQTSFLTPPVGGALFFLRSAAPPDVRMGDIYRGIIPFVMVQILAVVVIFLLPAVALWLPTLPD